jgi:hypothetical protein
MLERLAVGLRYRLREVAGTAVPSLRFVGLAYTGLGGMLALMLVVAVAAVPLSPALQQAAEPARQAVTSIVGPAADVLVGVLVSPALRPQSPPPLPVIPPPSAFSEPFALDVSIDVADQASTEVPAAGPVPVMPRFTARPAPYAQPEDVPAGNSDEEPLADTPEPTPSPPAPEPIVEPAAPPMLQ